MSEGNARTKEDVSGTWLLCVCYVRSLSGFQSGGYEVSQINFVGEGTTISSKRPRNPTGVLRAELGQRLLTVDVS